MTAVETAVEELCQWAGASGIVLERRQVERLCCYLETLLLWNSRFSLVSQHNPREIACKHFADALFAATCCGSGDRLVDLGSGAGFPGLPIAIAQPATRVCLIESKGKKCSFLREVIRLTSTANAELLHGRIEDAGGAKDHAGQYSMAISRALSGLPEFLRLARPFLRQGARAVAMKSAQYEPQVDAVDWQGCGFELAEVIPYRLPDATGRTLLVLRFT